VCLEAHQQRWRSVFHPSTPPWSAADCLFHRLCRPLRRTSQLPPFTPAAFQQACGSIVVRPASAFLQVSLSKVLRPGHCTAPQRFSPKHFRSRLTTRRSQSRATVLTVGDYTGKWRARCYTAAMSRSRGLWLVFLSWALVPTLTAQQVPDEVREVQIPEGAREVKYTKVRIDGKRYGRSPGSSTRSSLR